MDYGLGPFTTKLALTDNVDNDIYPHSGIVPTKDGIDLEANEWTSNTVERLRKKLL